MRRSRRSTRAGLGASRRGTVTCIRPRQPDFGRMHGVCMICMAMCGNGARTATARIITSESPIDDPPGSRWGLVPGAPRRGLVQRPPQRPVGVPQQVLPGWPVRQPGFPPGPSSVCPLSSSELGSGAGSRRPGRRHGGAVGRSPAGRGRSVPGGELIGTRLAVSREAPPDQSVPQGDATLKLPLNHDCPVAYQFVERGHSDFWIAAQRPGRCPCRVLVCREGPLRFAPLKVDQPATRMPALPLLNDRVTT